MFKLPNIVRTVRKSLFLWTVNSRVRKKERGGYQDLNWKHCNYMYKSSFIQGNIILRIHFVKTLPLPIPTFSIAERVETKHDRGSVAPNSQNTPLAPHSSLILSNKTVSASQKTESWWEEMIWMRGGGCGDPEGTWWLWRRVRAIGSPATLSALWFLSHCAPDRTLFWKQYTDTSS